MTEKELEKFNLTGTSITTVASGVSTQYWDTTRQTEQIERKYIPETNLRELAATLASKIEHKSVNEYLSDCDRIYHWLVQDDKIRNRK